MSGGVKIRPFKKQVPVDPGYVEKQWQLIKSAIEQIQGQNESDLSFEELYRNAYFLVLHKQGQLLYAGLTNVVNAHMLRLARTVEASIQNDFIRTLERAWSDHKTAMLMIRDILLYMDRAYIKDQHENVFDLGLSAFRDLVVRNENINQHLRNTMLSMVHADRQGDAYDRFALKSTCQMLQVLGVGKKDVYEEDFETPFLQQSAEFFRAESQQFLEEGDASSYLRKCEQRFNCEKRLAQDLLGGSTEMRLMQVLEKELIENHLLEFLDMENSGLVHMIEHNKFDDLQRMYRLCKRTQNGLSAMRTKMADHLETVGRALVRQDEDGGGQKSALKFINNLLELRAKYDMLLLKAFQEDQSFAHACSAAFTDFVNHSPKSAEYLSLFIDDKLRKGVKEMSESEVESTLDDTMALFRYLQDKDVFERYYKQHLAKRLLLNRSVSDEAERSVITRLKIECGYSFTNKLEGMFKDMAVSVSMMDKLRTHLSSRSIKMPIDTHVRVLTKGHWPSSKNSTCRLFELGEVVKVFEQFYATLHSGRKLTWQANFGSVDMSARFGTAGKPRRHILQLSTFQAVVLLYLNTVPEGETVSLETIKSETDITMPDLKRALQSMACGKARVLTKHPMTRDVGEGDMFGVNIKFASKLTRVKIQQIVLKETAPERLITKGKVDEDRKHQIEACIVRVMKARKSMHHSNLVAEVTEQLRTRFVPAPVLVKKRIESLIEREYIERGKDRKMYNYLA